MNPTTTPKAGAVADVAAIARGLEPTEISRLLEGRLDWRMTDWQDHCGDAGCPMCDGATIPTAYPNLLSAEDLAVRQHLEQGATAHD